MSVIVLILCAFKLGEIQGESNYLKRIHECATIPYDVSLQEFYGHDFKELTNTIWNHAIAHNANIYVNCIFKDLFKDE